MPIEWLSVPSQCLAFPASLNTSLQAELTSPKRQADCVRFIPPLRKIWILVNVVGMVVYLELASALWVRPGGEGESGGPRDAFYCLFILVPIIGSFLILDLVALVVILFRRRGQPLKTAFFWWLAIVMLWVATLVFDDHKSSRHIDLHQVGLTPGSARTPSASPFALTQRFASSAPLSASVAGVAGQLPSLGAKWEKPPN